ncbi:hypothetical protein [Marinagarivorans algicola]|uniref:hypothetical protein n=1 Tax=Marinagarivorans algicola TaxID=1513270 RepID=UPI0006B89A32|nr:hypothetical protein [Marinagarivorans algicola]
MAERREPTLSSPLANSAVLDEPNMNTGSPDNRNTSSKATTRRPTPVSQRVVEVKSPLAPLALVASVVALGVSGLLFWQLSTQIHTSESLLAKVQNANVRIVQLEQQLTATGDESSQSLAGLAAGVKALDASTQENSAEIRKLWGVAHDRNRKSIAQNKTKVAAAEKSIASLKATQKKNNAALQASLSALQGELAVLAEVQESQQGALSKGQTLVADIEALKSDLNRRITSNEEAIQAIDAFRLQVNRQLMQMSGAAAP